MRCKHRLHRVSDWGEHHKQAFMVLLCLLWNGAVGPHTKARKSRLSRSNPPFQSRPVSFFLLFTLFPASLFTKKESNQTGHMSVEISMTTLVKMYPCDLILNKCYVPNFALFINEVAREAFVVGSCTEIKIWLESVWRNCLPCVYGTETIPTPVQTCLDAIHPVFNLYHSEGEDKHYVPCNCD